MAAVLFPTSTDPASAQTAQVGLWEGRLPQTQASGALGVLAETWNDTANPGGSGQQFGSLAAISASGSNVTARVVDSRTVGVRFNPRPDGTLRVVVAAPHWPQSNPALNDVLGGVPKDAATDAQQLEAGHVGWWHDYWNRVGLLRLSSADGSAEYLENVRTLYLYTSAAEGRGTFPGSQGGVADLFSYSGAIASTNASCDSTVKPQWNSLTITSGAGGDHSRR